MTDSPTTGPAQAAADSARGGTPEDRVLLILAIDHRASLERDLYGLTAPPAPAQAACPDYVRYYLAARDGMLDATPDAEFW